MLPGRDILAHGAAGPYDEVLLLLPLAAVVLAVVVAFRKPKPRDPDEPAPDESASDEPAQP